MAFITYPIEIKENFVGRPVELKRLKQLGEMEQPQLLVVYGRRRVGKTELLEQTYRQQNVLKFEGISDIEILLHVAKKNFLLYHPSQTGGVAKLQNQMLTIYGNA